MATVERFEELEVWRTARAAVNAVYKASSDGAFSKDYGFRDQIRRAVVSIPSNIAEGFSRDSNREFIQFLFIVHPVKYIPPRLLHGAGGSTAEVQSQLYTALDQDYISREVFDSIYETLDVVAK